MYAISSSEVSGYSIGTRECLTSLILVSLVNTAISDSDSAPSLSS